MIVVDASAVIDALAFDGVIGKQARDELARDSHWIAPEHLVVEVFSGLRGLILGGKLSPERGRDAVDILAELVIESLQTAPLLPRMWHLRGQLSGYDAAYVVAAQVHDCPLVTGDARLARAAVQLCDVRLVVRS